MIWVRGKVRAVGCWAAIVVAAGGVAACGDGASEGARSRGIVESVDAAARTVTLDHEEIPGLMGAMTMEFEVAPGVELQSLASGTPVEFWVEYEEGRYVVTRIRPDGS